MSQARYNFGMFVLAAAFMLSAAETRTELAWRSTRLSRIIGQLLFDGLPVKAISNVCADDARERV